MIERYVSHTPVTDPGQNLHLLESLPDSVEQIVKAVHGLFLHIFWASSYQVMPNEAQRLHVHTRTVSRILDAIVHLDSRPLMLRRSLEKRFYGNCRDFAVFLCAALRAKQIPARARCGFATYLRPGKFEDHWVCEYYTEGRWLSVDAQLDDIQRAKLRISFEPLDIPPGLFLNGAEAWLSCRKHAQDPEHFGIFQMSGLWFVRSNLMRDAASLNGHELLPWDRWGLAALEEHEMSDEDYDLLDTLANLVVSESTDLYAVYSSASLLAVPPEYDTQVYKKP